MKKRFLKQFIKTFLIIIIILSAVAEIFVIAILWNKYLDSTLKSNIDKNITVFVPVGKSDYYISYEGFSDSIWIYNLNSDEAKTMIESISSDEGWHILTQEKYTQYAAYFSSLTDIEKRGDCIDFINTYYLIYDCDNKKYVTEETSLTYFNYFYVLFYNTENCTYCALFSRTYH